jgi:hypothetical protein
MLENLIICTYSQQCQSSLHRFIFLVSVIGVIIFDIFLDSMLKSSGEKYSFTLLFVEMDPDPDPDP